jgi:hypothetical protein
MARRRPGRFERQALMEALVRFNPERSGLVELLREAASNRTTTVRQARGTADMTVAEVNRARPELKKVYRDAGLAQARIAHTLDENTASLGPVANSIQAGIQLERAQGGRQLQEAKADALTDLGSRKVRAREGAQFAVQNANTEYAGEAGKIGRRLIELAREQGAFTAATTRELRKENRQEQLRLQIEKLGNSQSERNSLRSAGIDPETGQPIKGGVLDPNAPRYKGKGGKGGSGGRDWGTDAAHERAQDNIALALKEARTLKKLGASRAEIAEMLAAGSDEEEIQVYDTATGKKKLNPDGTPVTKKVPGLPQIKSQLYLSAALDEIFDGHLSRRNQQLLHSRGIQIARLPVTSYGKGSRSRRRTSRPPHSTGPGARQNRPT